MRARHSIGPRTAVHHQRGVTLVELMVALVIGLFITLAAAAALVVARQGFTAVDSGSQLRENARFTADLMQRIIVQAGYDNVASGNLDRDPASGTAPDDARWPGIRGFDNAWLTKNTNPSAVTNGSRSSSLGACGSTDTACNNFSDVLVVRFGGSSTPDGTTADNAIINCAGIAEPYVAPPDPPVETTRAFSTFHLMRTNDGEPALACTYRTPAGAFVTTPLVKGVEGMQVLYGTDGVVPGTPTPAGNTGMTGTVDRYLTAAQLETGTPAQAQNNWRRVHSVRIALLFRGDVGSNPARETKPWDLRNGGIVDTGKVAGFSLPTTPDSVGDSLVAPADGRLRQSMVFVVYLRNNQGYDTCVKSVAVPNPC
jgi:type IV pilus assembly protein PilW